MRLENKVAIVTGAASGIGKAIAEAYIREGAKVVFSDINEPEDFKESDSAIFVTCDISKAEEVTELVVKTLRTFDKIDILVNNAGVAGSSPLHETAEEEWDRIMDINLKGTFLLSKEVLPHMIKNKLGKIINIASIAGQVGFANSGPYCASKGGIIAMSRSMAVEYAASNINVNVIAPGIIDTAMTKSYLENPDMAAFFKASTPYPRLGIPEDIAAGAVYLGSNESDFVTGEVLTIDGGWRAK